MKRIRDSTTTQKKEITISLEYLGNMSLLAYKQTYKHSLEVAVKISNLTSFSKHQIDFATHLDLKTSFPNVSIQKCYINIRATFAIMSTLATPNAI